MQDRFKFRAGITLKYYKDNGDDAEVQIILYNISIDSGGDAITVHKEFIIDALREKGLSENEQNSVINWLNDEYCENDGYYYIDDVNFIEQCTGLKDKNGKLIYEGDIVAKYFSDRPFSSKAKFKIKNCLVYWRERGEFSIKYNSGNYRYYSALSDSFIGDCEVIGNIHENADLLEK